MASIGIIETIGFVGSVNALDTCLKTAAVEFVRFEKMSGGIVSIVITGDVAAVSASVAAGIEAAKAVGEYRTHTIIARLDNQTQGMIHKNSEVEHHVTSSSEATLVVDVLSKEIPDEQQEQLAEQAPQEIIAESLEVLEEIEAIKAIDVSPLLYRPEHGYSEDVLNQMTVSNLRKLAREMSLKGMSRERIKRSRKADLITQIQRELKEEEE